MTTSILEEPLPKGLRRSGRQVPAADGKSVALFLFRLPDGSDLEMVKVPAGNFIMGSNDAFAPDWEKPQHLHPLNTTYWIARNIITRGQYRAFCESTHHNQPKGSYFDSELPSDKANQPVIMVSWEDAIDYCKWAGLSLPTEAEWEKAARGTDGRRYPWGNEWRFDCSNFLDASCPGGKIKMGNGETIDEHMAPFGGRDTEHSDGFPYTSPIGSFPAGVSPYGALDMSGNIFQWVKDWWDNKGFPHTTQYDFTAPKSGKWHVDRGSSWGNPGQMAGRTTMRYGYAPNEANEHLGFRVALK